MYGDYVKTKASLQNVPYQSIVEDDLKRYQYKRKDVQKVVKCCNLVEKKLKMYIPGAPLQQYGFVRKVQIQSSSN